MKNPTDQQVTQLVAEMQERLDTCSMAGQAYRVKWHEVKTIIETIQLLQERSAEAKKWQMSIEEREAAVCPEDVGFDEYIRHLESKLAATPPETPVVAGELPSRAAAEIAFRINGGEDDENLTYPKPLSDLLDNPSIANERALASWLAAIITRHLAATPLPETNDRTNVEGEK